MQAKNTTSSPNTANTATNLYTSKGMRSAYSPRVRVPTVIPESESKTKQEFKDECNINTIMARYMHTGVIDFVNRHQAQYGDVTGIDYQECMQVVADAQTQFNELPSSIRTQFENNPAKFLDFVGNPANKAEMHKMGLLRPDYQEPTTNAPTPLKTNPEGDIPATETPKPKKD